MGQKETLKQTVFSYLVLFFLLYVTVFVGVYARHSLQEMEETGFVPVPLDRKKDSERSDCSPVKKEDGIRIQTIDLEAPLVFPEEKDSDLLKELDEGVTHYPESSLPGQEGAVILLGHSAPPGWPDIKYDRVFSRISDLRKGGRIEIYYQECLYTYKVVRQEVLNKGEEIPLHLTEGNNSSLILISCWPPGKDYKRIAVIAELETPGQSGSPKQE